MIQATNPKALQNKSSQSIKKLVRQKWLIVVVALMLTALGAALTGILFKAGIHTLENYRRDLLDNLPRSVVLPLLGGAGGFLSGTLIQKFAPAAK